MSKILFNILGYFFRSQGYKSNENGNLPVAEAHFSRAISYFEKSKNLEFGFDCQIQIGNIYKVSYLMDVAKEMFDGALSIAKRENKPELQAIAMINIGMLYGAMEDYENAEKAYEEALQLSGVDPKTKAQIYHNYGVLEQLRRNFEKSAQLLNNSIDEYDKIDLIPPQSLVYSDMGEVYASMDDYNMAKDSWEKAFKVYNYEKDEAGKADILLHLGELESDEFNIKQALLINEKLGREIPYSNCCTALALLLLGKDMFDEASDLLLTAIEIEQRLGLSSALIRDYANLAMLNQIRGNDELYQIYYNAAFELADETSDEVMKQEILSFFALNSDGE